MEEKNQDNEALFVDEKVSYSFLFFLMSGALLLVTLWAFWDDEYIRRGYKDFQEKYLISKYDIDMIESKRGPQPSLPHVDLLHAEVVSSNMVECVEHIYDCIFKILLKHEIHPNDVTIISTKF